MGIKAAGKPNSNLMKFDGNNHYWFDDIRRQSYFAPPFVALNASGAVDTGVVGPLNRRGAST